MSDLSKYSWLLLIAKSCLTLCTPWTIACQILGLACPWNFQVRVLECVAISPLQGIFWKLPGRLQSMGSQRVGHNLVTNTSPGGLSNPGIKSTSPALVGGLFTTEPPGKTESKSRSVLSDSLLPRPWILQAGRLEWVSLLFSRGSSQPKDQTQLSCLVDGFFTSWATRKAQ